MPTLPPINVLLRLIDDVSGKMREVRDNVNRAISQSAIDPGAFEETTAQIQRVQTNLGDFGATYQKTLDGVNRDLGKWIDVQRRTGKVVQKEMTRMQKVFKATGMVMNKMFTGVGKDAKKAEKTSLIAFRNIGRGFSHMGRTLQSAAWKITFAFLSFLGSTWQMQGALKMIEEPLRGVVNYFTDWENSLENLIMSFVWMQLAGEDTAGMSFDLGDAIKDLIEDGIAWQGVVGKMNIAAHEVNDVVGDNLIGSMRELADSLVKIAEDPSFRQWLADFTTGFGEGIAGMVSIFADNIDGMLVPALTSAANSAAGAQDSFEFWLASLAKIPGIDTEIFSIMGNAINDVEGELSEADQAFRNLPAGMQELVKANPQLIDTLGLTEQAFTDVKNEVKGAGIEIGTMTAAFKAMEPVSASFMGRITLLQTPILLLGLGLQGLGTALGVIFLGVSAVTSVMTIFGVSLGVAVVAISTVVVWVVALIGVLVLMYLYWDDIIEVVKRVWGVLARYSGIGILTWLWDLIGGLDVVKDAVSGVVDAFQGMYDRLLGRSIIPDLVRGISDSVRMIEGEFARLTPEVGIPNITGPTLTTVNAPINIGEISTEIDKEEFFEELDERLSVRAGGHQ